jgi:hypothetical protein
LHALTSASANFAHTKLHTNCRNTRRIGEETALLSVFSSPPYKLGQVDGLPVDYRYWKNPKHQLEKLIQVIQELLAEGMTPQDLVLLSGRRFSDSVASQLACPTQTHGTVSAVEICGGIGPLAKGSRVGFATIHSTERVDGVLLPHSQQTNRLSEVHRLVGRALGGLSGQRLLNRLGMPSTRHTLLRQVIKAAGGSGWQPAIRVVGVDDWAWRKGQSFVTILVDLDRSEVVDLLPTRSAKVLGEWLAQHPEVKVVSRDRQGVYAEGVRAGAPGARQVADRFHLTLNLRQAVERELAVRRSFLRLTPKSTPVVPTGGGTETEKHKGRQISIQSSVQQRHAEVARLRRQQKLELFQTIQRMKNAGMKVSQIARHRSAVETYFKGHWLPQRLGTVSMFGVAL